MKISGKSRVLMMIGHPVHMVRSIPAVNVACQVTGRNIVMIPLDVPPDQLSQTLELVRASETILGMSVTYPHKQTVATLVDDCTARSARLGAVNTVRKEPDGRLIGDMTDGLAMCHAIEEAGVAISGKTALVVGAGGGAGAAIAEALCERGIARLTLFDPDEPRLSEIMRVLKRDFCETSLVRDDGKTAVDIAINASPLGLSPNDPLPFQSARVAHHGLIADVVTPDEPSELIVQAITQGLKWCDGKAMADAQVHFQMRHWGLDATG